MDVIAKIYFFVKHIFSLILFFICLLVFTCKVSRLPHIAFIKTVGQTDSAPHHQQPLSLAQTDMRWKGRKLAHFGRGLAAGTRRTSTLRPASWCIWTLIFYRWQVGFYFYFFESFLSGPHVEQILTCRCINTGIVTQTSECLHSAGVGFHWQMNL